MRNKQHEALHNVGCWNISAAIRGLKLPLTHWKAAARGDFGSIFREPIDGVNRTIDTEMVLLICKESYYCEPSILKDICGKRSDIYQLLKDISDSHHSLAPEEVTKEGLYYNGKMTGKHDDLVAAGLEPQGEEYNTLTGLYTTKFREKMPTGVSIP